MTSFERIMPFLVLGLALASGVVLFFTLRVESFLAARKKINLANYRQKNNLFYIRRDLPVAVFAAALGIGSLAILIIALTDPVVTVYAIPLGILLLADAISCYLTLTRQRYARDIRIFDAYYVKVADLLANKERTQSDIGICRRRVAELRSKLEGTIAGFNKNLTVPISADFIPELFAPIDSMVREYLIEIERFSGAIEEDFNRALALFLHEEVQPELKVMPLRTFDEGTVDDLLATIKSSYGGKVASMAIERVNTGAVAGARALGNIMTLLHELGVKVDNESLTRFMRASAGFEDRAELAACLYKNHQIPVSVVCDVLIAEEWEWAFAPGMAEAYNSRELTVILTELLARDRVAMAYQLLVQLDSSHMPVLREAMRLEKERTKGAAPNETVREANAFCMILNNEYAVGNTASVFENIAMMVMERRSEIGLSDEEQVRIVEIVNSEQFLEGRREIAAMYSKATAFGKPLVDSSTRVFLQYVMAPPADESFLAPEKLTALLAEYRFTLSFGDLATLRALVAGWLLCSSKDEGVLRAVLNELRALPAALELPQEANVGNAAQIGRGLLTYLGKNDRVRLRSAIYRAESKRLALDRVLALCAKGE